MSAPKRRALWMLCALPVGLLFLALLVGRYGGGVGAALRAHFSTATSDVLH